MELLKSGFNIIVRLIWSNNAKKLLNYDIDGSGNIIPKDKKDFQSKIKKITPYVVTPRLISAQATKDELYDAVYSKIDPKVFPPKKTPKTKTITKPETKIVTKQQKKGTLVKSDWITDSEYRGYSGADRVKKMLKEMKKIDTKENENILLPSLRVICELALYDKLEDKGYVRKMISKHKTEVAAKNKKLIANSKPLIQIKKNWSPSFREMLTFILDESNKIINDPKAREALEKIVKGETNFVADLNQFIHNVHYTPVKGDSEKIWSKFGRLLFNIIDKIK